MTTFDAKVQTETTTPVSFLHSSSYIMIDLITECVVL